MENLAFDVHSTAADFSRCSDAEWQAARTWIENRRRLRAERTRVHEEELQEFRESIQPDIAARHESQVAWAVKNL
jgi:hypothetical protein